ncbi:uncharacterized protein MAM_01161 [Metarhizium album ARSEF 1941]|uniref:Integral membrane protein n=1 Tax=Metarhizium album (strain ARSEF 1941) TaxID=1081103 RepID=A0A0B2X3R5_METAS|nr:uncharacterized protein MAM_01161 [Metarhizium album ARSEF 1941]KHO00383.1 integral membrane protein [Metarhizium album ARSEF 1941]
MASLVPNVWAAIVVPVPASTVALALRLKARRMTRMGMGRDDCFAVAAWILAVGYTIDLVVWASCFKLGQPIGSYSEQAIAYITEKSTLILWTSEFLYSWSIVCAKLAVLCFYRRVFRFSSIRIPIVMLMTACCIWIAIRTFFTIFHCVPTQAFWDKTIPSPKCITNVRAFYLGTDATHSSMDFIILALPIYEVVRMKLPTAQKIAVTGLFAAGSLVGIASVFQIVESQRYDPHELPYDLALCMVWGGVELHLAVFIGISNAKRTSLPSRSPVHAGSLILLRPIFIKFIPGLASQASKAASRPTRSSNALQAGEGLRRPSNPSGDADPEAVGPTVSAGTRASSLALKGHTSGLTPICVHHEEYEVESLPDAQDNDSRCSASTDSVT